MSTITYKQIRTLRTRSPIEQLPDREVDGVLLVGQQPAIEFEDRHSDAGWDAVALYPAFSDGAQCWLELRRLYAAHGYSASGVQERVMSFEDGVQIFLERGVFALSAPADVDVAEPQPGNVERARREGVLPPTE